ncbi:uncharacterized protein LOC133784150 [Humulus lupulus]|uniref:uncharacterized protein LOC133784150 n=1 Tax=Humulus lupulus TaxID=3486 RepID=UPI002B400A50|nr:uncharacterized protein LOC133784150 [Humulus lupulus]XP_062079616.1 uncharacterized protein LOC133784150 [Humulus lupulus]
MALREAQRERALKYTSRHRTSRRGLANVREDLKTKLGVADVERYQVWIRAREKRKVLVTDLDKQIEARINELKEKVCSGEIIAKGRNDILTQALGTPEHPGRVRALGSFAKISSVFGRKPKITTEMANAVSKKDAEIARLRAELKALEEEKAKQAGGIDDMDEHDNDDEQSDEEYHTPYM